MFNRKKQETVNAVLDSDLEALLRQTDYYDKIISGKVFCVSCNTPLEIERIGIILPKLLETGEISLSFYCDDLTCIEKYHNGK